VVAEVALDLALDRRHREGEEVLGLVRVVAPCGAYQRQAGDLLQVVDRDAASPVPAGDRLGDGQVVDDDLVEQPGAFGRRSVSSLRQHPVRV